MNEFNTKLIELLELMYIYELTPMGYSSRDTTGIDILEKLGELKELNEQEIELQEQTPIYELDLTVRSANLLDRGGIKTIEDLENASFGYIAHLRNMGYKSLREIYTALIEWKEKHRIK